MIQNEINIYCLHILFSNSRRVSLLSQLGREDSRRRAPIQEETLFAKRAFFLHRAVDSLLPTAPCNGRAKAKFNQEANNGFGGSVLLSGGERTCGCFWRDAYRGAQQMAFFGADGASLMMGAFDASAFTGEYSLLSPSRCCAVVC